MRATDVPKVVARVNASSLPLTVLIAEPAGVVVEDARTSHVLTIRQLRYVDRALDEFEAWHERYQQLREREGGVAITVENVSVPLLREQRDYLLTLPQHEHIEGVINLLDAMLDDADGYHIPDYARRPSGLEGSN